MRTLISFTLAAVVTAGCAFCPSRVDDEFGRSVTQARAGQVSDPDAPSRKRAPAQTDGLAVKAAIDRYQKSFEAPPAPVAVFNIGSGSSSGTPAR